MRLRNPRPFFCGRMVLSLAPDSCAGLLFPLSWVVLIKLCCRTAEGRLMDAQEVWQLWEDAGQSGPAAICSLSFTALLMEKQTKQHGSEPCRHTRARTRLIVHTAKHKTSFHVTEMRGRLLSLYSLLLDMLSCVCVCVCACFFFLFFPPSTFQRNKVGCEPRLWDLDERHSLDGTWLRDMFLRQNRTWRSLRQNLIKLKQNTAIVGGVCAPPVSRLKWNSVK